MSFMATLLLYISDLLMDALAVIHLPLLLDLAGKVGKGIKQRTYAAKAHQFKNVLLSFQYALQRSADDTLEEIHPPAGWKTPAS